MTLPGLPEMTKKEEDWIRIHRRITTVATALAIAPLFLLLRDLTGQALFFIANVLLFGICHGSLDHLQCPPDKNGQVNGLRLIAFGFVYLCLSGLVIYVWFHDPGPMLVSFLSISCLHFALDEDKNLPFAERLLWGFLPVLAPCFLHGQEVSQLFSFLIGSQTPFSAEMIAVLKMLGFIICGFASVFLLIDIFAAAEKRSWTAFMDAMPGVLLFASSIILPPLLSFTLYFCWWHSLRQCIKLVASFRTEKFSLGLVKFLTTAAPLTLGSWALSITIFLMLPKTAISDDLAPQIRTIFYLLSALTVPHMVLALIKAESTNWAPSLRP